MSEPETALDLLTYEQAKRQAVAIAGATRREIAVVHCGCDCYCTKSASVAQANYPQDIVYIAKPGRG